jgi:hypothetical protein
MQQPWVEQQSGYETPRDHAVMDGVGSTLAWDPKGGPNGDGEYVPVVKGNGGDPVVPVTDSDEGGEHPTPRPPNPGFWGTHRWPPGCRKVAPLTH